MKKRLILSMVIFGVFSLAIFLASKWEYLDDENTLYSVRFGNTKLKFERYDYSLGQNQIVGVEKSIDKGKTYTIVTSEPITVSMMPKFIFLTEKLGFAISKSNLTKSNEYLGLKVTQDGGKTFADGIINYDNPDIDTLTVKEVPYYDNDILKLSCSIYQINEAQNGYEDIDITFVSLDNGLTWNLELSENERYKKIKEDIDKEMERYLYFIAPNCNKEDVPAIMTHKDLVYNNGFDKEKLLDADYKSYCKAYITRKCVEKGKWDWKATISCKNYTDTDYIDWAKAFPDKK